MTQLELELPLEKPWLSEWVDPMALAIYPLGEREEHSLGDENCDCQPSVEYPREDGAKMIVHNAFDGRE